MLIVNVNCQRSIKVNNATDAVVWIMYVHKLLYFFPVQNSAKHFLIDTKDDADAMKSAEFGYGNQNKDEDAFKQILKNRKRGGGNRSPPKGCYEKAKSAPKGICCDCLEHVKLSCGNCNY